MKYPHSFHAASFGKSFVAIAATATMQLSGDVQYWNPTLVANAAGSNEWGSSTSAWAPTNKGTTTPEPWVSGNDASFSLNNGSNFIVVNGPEVSALAIDSGTYRFLPGTGPLLLAGPFTNKWANVRVDAPITLTDNQRWTIGRDTWFTGAVRGPWWIERAGTGALMISNANNQVAGLTLEDGITRFYGGGSALGGTGSELILGSPDQTSVVRAEIYAMRDRGETEWDVGSVTTEGYGELHFRTFDNTTTHRAAFDSFSRVGHSVLGVRQDWQAFPVRQMITLGNADTLAPKGILPPWILNTYSSGFFAYDGMLKEAVPLTTAPETWTPNDVVHVNAAQTVDSDCTVEALRVSAPLTLTEGATLTTDNGGIILVNQSIAGDGALSSGTQEMLVYATGTSSIEPTLDVDDFVLWGGGTLTTRGISWSGSTTLHHGALRLQMSEDTTLSGRTFSGSGELRKAGDGGLTVTDSHAQIGSLSFEDNGLFRLRNSSFSLRTGITITAPLMLEGSTLNLQGPISTGNDTDDVNIELVGSGIAGESTVMDCHDSYVRIGIDGGCHNSLLIDGNGITRGASIEGISEPGASGFALGVGANSARNLLRITRGGWLVDNMPHSNRNNGIGQDPGSHSNRVEVIGGEGVVSRFYKAFPRTLGENGGSYNTMLIDGCGVPGSALFESSGGRDLQVGSGGGEWNHVIVTNGGQFLHCMINVGPNGNNNRADILGAGSAMIGSGGDSTFSFGAGTSSNNVLYVADRASISGFSKWQTGIGNAGNPDSGSSYNNQFTLASGATFTSGNGVNIGRKRGATSEAIQNGVTITGAGSRWSFGNATIELGVSDQGSLAQGNTLEIEKEGTAEGRGLRVGSMADTTDGGESTGNAVLIRSGGSLVLSDKATCGFTRDSVAMSSSNRIDVTQGGILETRTLEIGSPLDNAISITDGGILQFPTRTPTILSLAADDILLVDAILSYRNLSNVRVNDVHDTQLSNLTWRGNNALRLTQSSMDTGVSEDYIFDASPDSSHYQRLEMVQGDTVYRGQSGDALTIGPHGEMLCSNTTARVELPFEMKGHLRIVDSTLTLTQEATLQGTLEIDLPSLPEGTAPILAKGPLTFAPGATLSFTGKPTDGQILLAFEGDLSGDFATQGLSNQFRAYVTPSTPDAPGTITLLRASTILFFR